MGFCEKIKEVAYRPTYWLDLDVDKHGDCLGPVLKYMAAVRALRYNGVLHLDQVRNEKNTVVVFFFGVCSEFV